MLPHATSTRQYSKHTLHDTCCYAIEEQPHLLMQPVPHWPQVHSSAVMGIAATPGATVTIGGDADTDGVSDTDDDIERDREGDGDRDAAIVTTAETDGVGDGSGDGVGDGDAATEPVPFTLQVKPKLPADSPMPSTTTGVTTRRQYHGNIPTSA